MTTLNLTQGERYTRKIRVYDGSAAFDLSEHIITLKVRESAGTADIFTAELTNSDTKVNEASISISPSLIADLTVGKVYRYRLTLEDNTPIINGLVTVSSAWA